MLILVTAFGPFGGRLENASSLVLKELRKKFPEIRTRILPVDAVLAPARLRSALRQWRPDALIMLGEAGGSLDIRLEKRAWNEKNFGIPDISGRQPTGIPVRRGAADYFDSTLPLGAMKMRLEKLGTPVAFSDDAGRYLCNQLFFSARDYLEREKIMIPAGFIHLPLESALPTSEATEAVANMIYLLSE